MDIEILVIDDEESIRKFANELLTRVGYKVTVAENAESAIELIQKNNYQLILTDKNLPGTDHANEGGMDILKFTKNNFPHIQVIMMTGYATIETAIESLKLGAFDYLLKPLRSDEITTKIKRAIEFQQFINPEAIIDIYKNIYQDIVHLVEENIWEGKEEKLDSIFNSCIRNLDQLFATLRSWEGLIVDQRDALGRINALAERLKEITPEESDIYFLVDKICRKAQQRI